MQKPTADYHIDPKLKEWATPAQARYLDAIEQYGGGRAAARALKIDNTSIFHAIARLKKKAALKGYSPEHNMTRTVPDPFVVKGVSTYYDKEGNAKGQWVKSALREERAEAVIREFTDWLAQHGARGMAPISAAPTMSDDDLLAVYPMGDPHFGLYSWAAETEDDFDLSEAERVTCGAVDRLVAASPPAKRALLLNLGDFTHADDSSNLTPGHGNALDVDTRYGKVAQVGLRALIHCVRRLLEKHEQVDVWMMPGNHDPHVSFMLALCLDSFFNNELRVKVDLSPSLYRYMRFGKVLIGSHHGHGAKGNDLPLIMAADRPEDWGQTTWRHWLCGHIHHWTAKEHPGAIVETFRTLAAKDAWHAGKGYRSGRDMNVITYHKEFGEIQRTRCDIAMLSA
ncbi:MAG TPA: oxidoreductase [Oxalobacteraceae bacterium]|jgi:hypothetical protein|nr:oxidoreductase [Oxalobacteraceae bacterium]